MEKHGKQIIIYVDERMASWLDGKVARGYKRSGLIRHILQDRMDFEGRQKASEGVAA